MRLSFHQWSHWFPGKCSTCGRECNVVFWNKRLRRNKESGKMDLVGGDIPVCGLCFKERVYREEDLWLWDEK